MLNSSLMNHSRWFNLGRPTLVAWPWLVELARGHEMFDEHTSKAVRERRSARGLIILVAATGLLLFWSAALFGLLQLI
jgi:hypothetical protein